VGHPSLDLEGRVAVVTGGTAGIGRALALERARDATLAAFGRIDVLVNCAGRIKRTPILDLPEEEWNGILETNLTGTPRACQVFGRPMLERGKELRMRAPLKHFGEVEELVGACVFLASDAASFVNGQVIAVDGGFLASGVNQ
jgi:NAD(P)-dependent dehydrogenase (short-subunit alcohol dehydrogenase family)